MLIRFSSILGSLLLLFAFGCSPKVGSAVASTAADKSFADRWTVTVKDTPLGTVMGVLDITQGENGLTGTYEVQGRKFPLSSVVANEKELVASFYFSDYSTDVELKLSGTPTADNLVGVTSGEYPTTAVRIVQ